MKISTKHDDAAVADIAQRWGLQVTAPIEDTRRARLFKVQSANGPAVLKFYKRYGSSGEGAAIPFLADLLPRTGPTVYRKTPGRTVVLMEWLDGPTLADLVADGQEADAIEHLCHVARRVQDSRFGLAWSYQRLAPTGPRDLVVAKNAIAPLAEMIDRARAIFTYLNRTTPVARVIHGDLGFQNVILTQDGPRLLDPKGVRADPVREYARVLVVDLTKVSLEDYTGLIIRRTKLIAQTAGIDRNRLLKWAAVELAGRVAKRPAADAGTSLPFLASVLDLAEAGM